MSKKKVKKIEPIEEIKRLIVLGLINQGVKRQDIASVLGVDAAIISRMIPSKKSK